MGRLNKALTKRVGSSKKTKSGLSSSAAKALENIKDTLNLSTNCALSAPAPSSNIVTFTQHVEKTKKNTANPELKKKNLKTVEKSGKIVKIGKKEKLKIRKGLLVDKLTAAEEKKKEEKAKKIRDKVVIVKDIKPLMDNLDDIEEEIKQKDKLKKVTKPKKMSKHTLKLNQQKKQFMADIDFLKQAVAHPAYVKNPIETVSIHLKNTIGVD